MASANCRIAAELISDYAADGLDAADVQAMKEAINRDKGVACQSAQDLIGVQSRPLSLSA